MTFLCIIKKKLHNLRFPVDEKERRITIQKKILNIEPLIKTGETKTKSTKVIEWKINQEGIEHMLASVSFLVISTP